MKREHIFSHYEQDATRYWKLREGGYATPLSVCQGDEVTFHISNSRSYYDVFVFHEGAKRRLVKEINGLRGGLPPIPESGYRDGFAWPATISFQVPRETNTYAAYNCVGGKCLFPYLSTDRSHSNLVTFERPLQPDIMGGFHAWDQFFTSWLDAEGYQVDYCVNADHDQQPDLLDDYPAHLRICHGEYSSRQECEQLQRLTRRTTVSTRTWGSTRTDSTPPSRSTKRSSRGLSSRRQPSSGRTAFTGTAARWHGSRAMSWTVWADSG